MGLWNEGNGLYFQISQYSINPTSFLYRHITHMKDYSRGHNKWMPCSLFESGDYERLIITLSDLKKPVKAVLKVV